MVHGDSARKTLSFSTILRCTPSPPALMSALYGPYTGGSFVGTICASATELIMARSNRKNEERRDNNSIARMSPLEAICGCSSLLRLEHQTQSIGFLTANHTGGLN